MVKKELDKVVWISIFLLIIVLFFAISTSNKASNKNVKVNFEEKFASDTITITADVSEEEGVSVLTPSGMIVAGAIDLITGEAVSEIEKVEFKVDGIIIGTKTSAPYSIQWDTTKFSNGGHEITAVVTYKSGNKESSSPVKVTVDNAVQVSIACNNNIKETGEVCDGTDLDNKQCTSFSGYTGGTLKCKSDCSGFDFSQCTSTTPSTTGNTYYVATNGNDGNTCEQSKNINTPRRSISAGISCLSGSDTLYIRGGIYGEAISGKIPSGSSFSSATVIASYPGEAATIKPM